MVVLYVIPDWNVRGTRKSGTLVGQNHHRGRVCLSSRAGPAPSPAQGQLHIDLKAAAPLQPYLSLRQQQAWQPHPAECRPDPMILCYGSPAASTQMTPGFFCSLQTDRGSLLLKAATYIYRHRLKNTLATAAWNDHDVDTFSPAQIRCSSCCAVGSPP